MNLLDIAEQAERDATNISRDSDLHGPAHWRAVAKVGRELDRPGVDTELVFLFACLHDTQRHRHLHDPGHGQRAAEYMRSLNLGLSKEREDLLAIALSEHDKPVVWHRDKTTTVGTCWDADRLNLPRFRVKPELPFMSTPTVRGNLDHWIDVACEATRLDCGWAECARMVG